MNHNDEQQNFKREIKIFDKIVKNLTILYTAGGDINVLNIPDKPLPVVTSAPYKEGGHLELARLEKLERLQQEKLLRKSVGS